MGEKLTDTAEIIEHKGVQIVFHDLSGLKGRVLADALIDISQAMISKIKHKNDWVAVNLFTDCTFDDTATKVLIRVHKAMMPYCMAIGEVGLSPIQQSGIQLVHSVAKSKVPLRFLDSVEEAKDWVVSIHKEQTLKKS